MSGHGRLSSKLAIWVSDAISVGLGFLTSNLGSPEEPSSLREARSRGLFLLVAIPPASWIALMSKVMGREPEWILVGPAFAWILACFLWMVRTYGPSRYTRSLS